MQNSKTVQKALWFLILMGIWEGAARLGGINPLLLPSFSEVMAALFSGMMRGVLLLQLAQSLTVVGAGLATGLVLAVAMAYLDYFYPTIRNLLELLSSALHPLPGIALLPVVVLWAGVGTRAVFIIIVHAVVWSLYLNIKMGFRNVAQSLVEVASDLGARDLQLFRHVLMPCSAHAIKTGLQIGWSRGWRALISAEMVFGAVGGLGGIGWYIYERRAFMDTPSIYAGILLIVVVGVAVEQLFFKAEK